MSGGMNIRKDGGKLDFLSLGALVHSSLTRGSFRFAKADASATFM